MNLASARALFDAAPLPPEGSPGRPWPEPGQMWVTESGIRLRVRAVRGTSVLCGYVGDADLRHTTSTYSLMKRARFIPRDRELDIHLFGELK